eukprot:6513504-Pyramimonas_sp.AAC.1
MHLATASSVPSGNAVGGLGAASSNPRGDAVEGIAMTTGAPALRGTTPLDPTLRFASSDPPAGQRGIPMRSPLDSRRSRSWRWSLQ